MRRKLSLFRFINIPIMTYSSFGCDHTQKSIRNTLQRQDNNTTDLGGKLLQQGRNYIPTGRKSRLSLRHKLTLVRFIILSIPTYEQIAWGHKRSRQEKLSQGRINIRCTVNAPWYTPINEMIRIRTKKDSAKFGNHLAITRAGLRSRFVNTYKRPKNQVLEDHDDKED